MVVMAGIVAYGVYIPHSRLERSEVAAALSLPPGGGTRSVASYDEDTTSMAVEAARLAMRAAPGVNPEELWFATTAPAYADKTNACAIHAALGLNRSVPAYDAIGAVRSGIGLIRQSSGLVVLSDIRTGLPGGPDERDGGDGAAAFLFGDDEVIAEPLAFASSTAEFLDRWRDPGDSASRVWEERFGETAYVPLAREAMTDALKQAGLTAEAVDALIVTGTHPRAARRLASSSDDLTSDIGNCGAAHPGILLADALDRAETGHVIMLVTLADGADVSIWRTTDALDRYRQRRSPCVRAQVEAGRRPGLPYATFLTWRGLLRREPPRRPEPDRPAGPPSFRHESWKFGFTASRCETCGTRHLPPHRVCVHCQSIDQMAPERLADAHATIVTFSVDRLAFSLSPPTVVAALDFDGGGRFQCELTDVDASAVAVGDRVEMTFRRLYTADGVHNYFWKAKPLRGDG